MKKIDKREILDMKKYILIAVNERKIFEPDYFETLDEAQAEMRKRVEQIVSQSGGETEVDFEINNDSAYVTDAHFELGDGNWDFAICEVVDTKYPENIKDAMFTSVWDGGFEITTKCKVNTETKEIFDIEVSESNADMVEHLDEEYVTIDGIDYRAVTAEYANLYPEEMDEETFWYE